MSKPELITDYAHSELNLGVERPRLHILPTRVEKAIAKRPVVTTTAVVLVAAAAAGIAAGLLLRASANRKRRRRPLADLIR